MERSAAPAPEIDTLTVVAVAALAFIVSNVLHEGLGHGGACLLVGGKPVALTAVYFDNDPAGLSTAQSNLIAAGGPIVNLVTGIVGLVVLRRLTGVAGPSRLFVWLVTTIGLFMATGYLLFSGVGGIGDVAKLIEGLEPAWMWRVLAAVTGAASYFVSALIAVRAFGRLFGGGRPGDVARAKRVAMLSYVTGGVVICAAGLLNPMGFVFVLISAAASTLGGASGLLWMMAFLAKSRFQGPESAALMVRRSPAWIIAGAVVLAVYVLVLGPGVKF